MSKESLNVAVVGVGHLGRIHAAILASMPDVRLVGVVDSNSAQAEMVARDLRVPHFTSHRSVLDSAQAVSIAVPTRHHFAIARDFLSRGVPVLLEKPMTTNLEEARELVSLARQRGVALQIGHVERFNPAVVAVRPYLSDPLYIEADRIGPFSFRSLDIGVVLDLMIHDLDIVLDLVDDEVDTIEAIGFPVLSRHEDVANARVAFRRGCVVNFTASRVSPTVMRKIRVFQRDSYLSLDYGARKAQIFRRSPSVEAGTALPASLDPARADELKGELFERFLSVTDVDIDEQEPLRAELAAFVQCVRDRTEPLVSGEKGLRAVALAVRILDAIGEHRQKVLR